MLSITSTCSAALHYEEVEDIFNADLFIDKSYSVKTVSFGELQLQLFALHSASSTDHDLTGQIVWPAAELLASFLVKHRHIFDGVSSVVELGSGAGLSGLVAAKLCGEGGHVVLTDNNQLVLELLQRNIHVNFPNQIPAHQIECCELSWGLEDTAKFVSVHGKFDLILGADVVFWLSAVPLLFETVHYFLSQQPSAKFVLSYVNRCELTTKLLFDTARLHRLKWKIFDSNADTSEQHLDSNIVHSAAAAFILILTLDETRDGQL